MMTRDDANESGRVDLRPKLNYMSTWTWTYLTEGQNGGALISRLDGPQDSLDAFVVVRVQLQELQRDVSDLTSTINQNKSPGQRNLGERGVQTDDQVCSGAQLRDDPEGPFQ